MHGFSQAGRYSFEVMPNPNLSSLHWRQATAPSPPKRPIPHQRIDQPADAVDFGHDFVAYLSRFMTLSTGDLILTGTPEGVVNVNEGDEVVTEIDGVGRLVNTLVGDGAFER